MRVRIVNCDAQSDFWVSARSEKAALKTVKKSLDKSKVDKKAKIKAGCSGKVLYLDHCGVLYSATIGDTAREDKYER